ncbi:MAG TPA: RecX family transcriptional regulator [Armatimonadota bacterium]|nr:RecX family transcriptional regulator [Armatimonadota bacterium]
MAFEQRISAIEAQEKKVSRRSIFIDGKFVLGVDESVVADLGLHVGQQIDQEELQAIARAETLTKAKEKALRLLEYRPRSRAELARRLSQAGFAEDIVEETLTRLADLGLIDDVQFSRSWVRHRLAGKAMGKTRIKWELRQKGIPTEVAEEALSAVDAYTEHQLALDAARRRWEKYNESDERTRRRRLASFLRRQGFDWDVITKIINELSADREPG